MRWLARALLAAMILAALYGLYVAPVTLDGNLPLLGHHTRVLWFCCWSAVVVVVATAAIACVVITIAWCIETGWPKEEPSDE